MPYSTSAHPWITRSLTGCAARLLFLLGILLSQTSCITATDRIIPGTSVREDTGIAASGGPQATFFAHPDHQGWTVTLTQPLLRHVEVLRSEQREQHSYHLNPLAIPAGAFACSSSMWGWAWNAIATIADPDRQLEQRKALRDFTMTSCLMALSIVRTAPQWNKAETLIEHKVEPDSRPLNDGRVTLTWHGLQDVTVSYPLDSEGQTLVRLAHLATALRQNHVPFSALRQGHVDLRAWHQGHLVQQWPLEVTGEQLDAAARLEVPVLAARARWPRALVFRIVTPHVPTSLPAPEHRFVAMLLHHGMTVVASEEQQTRVQHELEQNLHGIVEDDNTMGPGHWRAANVLLLVKAHEHANSSGVTVSCLNIRTRELLAQIDVAAGPQDLQGALDVATARFQEVLRLVSRSQGHPIR